MTTQTRSQQPYTRLVKNRIMRWLTPVIILIFVLLAIVGVSAVVFDTWQNFSQIQAISLEDVEEHLESELANAFTDVRGLALSPVASRFAEQAAQPSLTAEQLLQLEAEMVDELEQLLEEERGRYLTARYIDKDGALRVEAIYQQGSIDSNTDVILNARDPQTDPTLQTGLITEFGDVSISAFDVIQNENTDAFIPIITVTSPITRTGDSSTISGVVELRFDATEVLGAVRNARLDDHQIGGDSRRYLLIDSAGQLLADTDTTIDTYLGRFGSAENYSQEDTALFNYLANNPGEINTELRPGSLSLVSVTEITFGRAPMMPWRIVIVDNVLVAFSASLVLVAIVIIFSGLAGIATWYFTDTRLSIVLRRFEVANDNIQRLTASEHGTKSSLLSIPADLNPDKDPDEATQMLHAARHIAKQIDALNQRIEQQTERYNRNLSVAARISRETAMLQDIDELLTRAINLISSTFKLYHTQVFLIDEAGDNAVLVYSRGEAGQRLLEHEHKLAVGSTSVIGRVTETGEPVIVNDTYAPNTVHMANPLLADTRAEMGLPLQIGDQMIGALDLQSDKPNAFSEEDLQTYQLIADQLAIAVYKTRLLREFDQRVQQIEMLNRQLTQMAWEELEREVGLDHAYRYNLLEVEPGDIDSKAGYSTSQMLTIPIRIRGEVIGTILAAPPEGGEFTENDWIILRSVSDRVALAVENARLFRETQTNLAETSTLYQTSRYLNEAEEMEDIIEAIVLSTMPDAVSGQIAIFDDYPVDGEPEWLEIIASWRSEFAEPQADINHQQVTGDRFEIINYQLLRELSGSQVTLISDIERDVRLDPLLREWFRHIGGRSVVFVPLSVTGIWRGTVIVEFTEPREFTEREGRIYNNLIDQAGIAIDNRLLLKQTERALTQNERLYAASRIINQAQGFEDLVRAGVSTTDARDLNFGLAIFEGELDETGWPTTLHHVAQSKDGEIFKPDTTYFIRIDSDSPLRNREPQSIIVDQTGHQTLTLLATLIQSNNDSYGVIFPLFAANQPVALFFVTRETIHPLSDENQEIYRAITGQMSTVIENRRLLEQTASALDETRRLYTASRAITAAPDINTMYEAAITHLSQPLERISRISVMMAGPNPSYDPTYLDRVYMWVNQKHKTLVVPTVNRLEDNQIPFSRIGEQIDEETQMDALEDVLINFPMLKQYLEENNTHSVVIKSMESNKNWLGLIVVESEDHHAFNEQYIRFCGALADQIAIALENQLLFEQAQQEARQALALAEASQLANQIGGQLTEGINTLFARVAETAGYDRWLLMELDERTNQLHLITQYVPEGVSPLAPQRFDMAMIEHPIADTIHFNRTLVINDPDAHTTLQDNPDLANALGKHIATPLMKGENIIGALLVGRDKEASDLNDRDETLVSTLAAQVAVTMDNQRLFEAAENERLNLHSILNTLPAGVLVLDATTLKPVQYNAQIHDYLAQTIDDNVSFSAEAYHLYRTGTNLHYPHAEFPIFATLRTGESAFSDDVSVITDEGHQADLLVNAAPIRNAAGEIINIVAAFEDISNLRSLENTLQDNLRETISLYEATRSLSEAEELDEVLDVVLFQLIMNEPEDAHVILLDEETQQPQVVRDMVAPIDIEGLSESVLNSDRIILIDDVQAEHSITETDRVLLRSQGIEALASLPLRAGKRGLPLGWVLVNYSDKHFFSPEDERFLSTLGDNAAVAIDNRYLFQSTQRALRETSSLYSATTTINRARDLPELSQVIRVSVESLSPDIMAGYLMIDPSSPDHLEEMFNISMDSAPVDFSAMLTRYGLFRDESIFIDDLYTAEDPTPFEQALSELGHIRALGSVSLRVKGMPDGRLFIAYHEPHVFTEGEKRYLNAIADSASVVIDNIILLEQIQKSLEETSILYQASRSMADATKPEDILDVVVQKLIGAHVNQVFVALLTANSWNASSATVEIVSSWQSGDGIDLEGITLTSEQFPAWTVLASKSVINIDNVATASNLNDIERMGVESLDARSLTVIPLRVPARSIGAVWISSREPHYHDERERRIYQAFAEQASLSLEASFLLEQTEERARQLATSAEVSNIASSILDLDILLPRVVDLIRDQFGYDHVQVFLMDEKRQYAVLRASTGEPGQQLLAIHHKLERGSASVIGQVTERAEPVIALDTSDARVVHRPNPYLPLTRSEMALPIIIKGEVIGALDVQSNQPNAFGDDDTAVLTTLAAQISVAIDNARLFEQAESRADEMSFLFTITTAAASAETLEEALLNVVELLRGSLDAQAVGIYLVADEEDEDDQPMMEIVALSGSQQPLTEVEKIVIGDEDNLIGRVAEDLIPVIIDDIADEPRYLPLVPASNSAVIVPLNTGGEIAGLVAMESSRIAAYDQDTLTLLLALGGTLAAIVQNARLIEDISQKNEELRQLDRIKSAFLANMSHELRTPLNSIIGFSRVMLKGIDGPLTEMQEQDLSTIYNSGQHLLGLINDILDHAKIEADKMDLQQDFFEVRTVAEGVRSIGIGLVKEKPVDIFLQIANNLPQAFGDEFRTRQVLLNLVSNAAKFTSEGNITISVYTEEHPTKGTLIRIDVADTGIGIDQKDLPLLFEAFRQVDSSLTRVAGGTGLGLPIAKSLVELQGGEMLVETALNEGTTFSITVPTDPSQVAIISRGDGDDENEGKNTETAGKTASASSNTIETTSVTINGTGEHPKVVSGPPPGVFEEKRQILLIEDNADMVDQYRRLLQREGFEVEVASDLFFAETMASGLRPTLILMDVNFADGKGWNVLKNIKDRDDTFDIPVIIITLDDDSERAYRMGAHNFIQKPYMPDELVKAVLEAEQESNVDRILIIDDQPESTRLIEEVLLTHGKYRVFAAHTGPEGIALVARRRPDLIVLDLRMPGMDGFAVLEDLRSRPETASIPVVVVTGESTLSEDERNKLTNLEIVYKTDLNQNNYQTFIDEVRRKIADYHGE